MTMGNDIPFTLLSVAPSIPGLLILHFASRTPDMDRRDFGSWKGIAFIVGGLVLIALPLFLWCGFSIQLHPERNRHVSPTDIFLLAGYLDVMFFWFLWSAKSFSFQIPKSYDNPWEENWGVSYSPELKRRFLSSLFAQMDRDGKIGNLVVDVGSGAIPVSHLLPATPERRYILLDIAGRNEVVLESQYIRFDAENVLRPRSMNYRRALLRVCAFLGMDPRSLAGKQQATALMFSDVLNYLDFRKVIAGFADFLKADGRIIIINLPSRGVRALFSDDGLKRNDDLYPFLEEHDLEIEYKDFPCRPEGETDESGEMIVLVARKAGRTVGLAARVGG